MRGYAGCCSAASRRIRRKIQRRCGAIPTAVLTGLRRALERSGQEFDRRIAELTARMEGTDQRFAEMTARMDRTDQRFAEMTARMDRYAEERAEADRRI